MRPRAPARHARAAASHARGGAATPPPQKKPHHHSTNYQNTQKQKKALYGRLPPASIDADYLWGRLAPLLWYLPSDAQREQVRDALNVAFAAHAGQARKSGEPFVTHPVEVSRILAEMRLDAESLVAGLLHDTVEDTDRVRS